MADPVLAVDGLDAYYGSAPILQNVQFEMGAESVAVVGRNGMGKSTLCASIVKVCQNKSALPMNTGTTPDRARSTWGMPRQDRAMRTSVNQSGLAPKRRL